MISGCRRVALAVLASAAVGCGVGDLGYAVAEVELDSARTEAAVVLPAWPNPDRLVEFRFSGASEFRYFVDPDSVQIGSDRIVRYTLVAVSGPGARNVTYEGIRCDTRERRVYAYGRRDATWVLANSSTWTRVIATQLSPWLVLYQDFFCPGQLMVESSREAVDALKAGIHPRARQVSGGR